MKTNLESIKDTLLHNYFKEKSISTINLIVHTKINKEHKYATYENTTKNKNKLNLPVQDDNNSSSLFYSDTIKNVF